MKSVYIASSYTLGDVAVNVRKQIAIADELIDLNFAPYVPLLCHFQHLVLPRQYDDWLKLDLYWILKCDILLRLPGVSSGADTEVYFARENNIPVCFSVEELLEWRNYEL